MNSKTSKIIFSVQLLLIIGLSVLLNRKINNLDYRTEFHYDRLRKVSEDLSILSREVRAKKIEFEVIEFTDGTKVSKDGASYVYRGEKIFAVNAYHYSDLFLALQYCIKDDFRDQVTELFPYSKIKVIKNIHRTPARMIEPLYKPNVDKPQPNRNDLTLK